MSCCSCEWVASRYIACSLNKASPLRDLVICVSKTSVYGYSSSRMRRVRVWQIVSGIKACDCSCERSSLKRSSKSGRLPAAAVSPHPRKQSSAIHRISLPAQDGRESGRGSGARLRLPRRRRPAPGFKHRKNARGPRADRRRPPALAARAARRGAAARGERTAARACVLCAQSQLPSDPRRGIKRRLRRVCESYSSLFVVVSLTLPAPHKHPQPHPPSPPPNPTLPKPQTNPTGPALPTPRNTSRPPQSPHNALHAPHPSEQPAVCPGDPPPQRLAAGGGGRGG